MTTKYMFEVELSASTHIAITRRAIVKSTARSVSYISQEGHVCLAARRTNNRGFFDTWVEAHEFLEETAKFRVHAARRNLEICQSYYGNVIGMKEPVYPPEEGA